MTDLRGCIQYCSVTAIRFAKRIFAKNQLGAVFSDDSVYY